MDMQWSKIVVFLGLIPVLLTGQVPNGNFEELDSSGVFFKYWDSKYASIEEENPIEGKYSLKLASISPTYEGHNGPVWASTIFRPKTNYKFLSLSIRIDSILAGGKAMVFVDEYDDNQWKNIGYWEDSIVDKQIRNVVISIQQTNTSLMRLRMAAYTHDNGIYYVGYSQFTVDNVKLTNTVSNDRIVSTPSVYRIYPNPVTDKLRVNLHVGERLCKMRLFDSMGRIVRKVVRQSHMKVGDLPSGNYTLIIYMEDGHIIRRVVQKR